MKFFHAVICAAILVPSSTAVGHANEGINVSVRALAMTVAQINVTSDSCDLAPRAGLRAGVYEALAPIPDIDMNAVVEAFVNEQTIESNLSDGICDVNSDKHLQTLYSIYDRSLSNLKQRITEQVGN